MRWWLWVVSVSYASIALLALDAYDATTAVTAGAVVGAVLWFFTPARFGAACATPGRPVFPILLLVLLVALLFRTDPFRTMHGGQDQGIYVAMSSHLQREGSVFIDDPLPEALPDQRSREGFSSVGFHYLARAFRAMRTSASAAVATSLFALAAACVSLVFVRITGVSVPARAGAALRPGRLVDERAPARRRPPDQVLTDRPPPFTSRRPGSGGRRGASGAGGDAGASRRGGEKIGSDRRRDRILA